MEFEAIAIALLGFSLGLFFRVNVLLPILLFLLILSIGYSVGHHVGFLKGALTILGVQAIAQGSYFVGLVVRSLTQGTRRWVLV